MKIAALVTVAIIGLWLAAKGGNGLWNSEPAKPGLFRESSKPDLAPGPWQGGDYTPPENRFAAHPTRYDGDDRRWYGMGPAANADTMPEMRPPAIVLLHGSKRDGRTMLDMWQGLARREQLTLIAPDALNPADWSEGSDGEEFLEQVLSEAAAHYSFNPARVYLFGHSAGANHALSLANQGKGPWRAVAIHAGGILESSIDIPAEAIPLRLYLGDKDEYFPVETTKAQAKALAAAGHATDFIVIPGHNHWYYDIGPRLASHAWSFFKQH